MCGILGSVNQTIDKSNLDLIKHRGPDDSGIEIFDIDSSHVYFAHRRLSIQDLTEAGHQPMTSSDGNFIIIFNGEVYNHYSLRQKLNGITFKGHSDTETILNYIARFGIESVKDFNGIFAFALLDLEYKKIHLVRDRFGVKPLYFFIENNRLLFSSEIRPIQHMVNNDIDRQKMSLLLKIRYNPSPTTLYEKINKLEPGHILTYDIASCSSKKFSFHQPVLIDNKISFEVALNKYEELFEKAVKRQLLADVEIGVLLSGGVDSALVAYYAQKYSKKPIKTFTVGFQGKDDSDEREEARETANLLGTEHFEVEISNDEFERVFSLCNEIIEEPLATTSIIPMYFLNELASKHVKVVLTGQGADEPLGGYKRYLGEKFRSKNLGLIIRLLRPISKFINNEQVYRALNALGEGDIIRRFSKTYEIFKERDIVELIGHSNEMDELLIQYYYNLLKGNEKRGVEAMMSNDLRMNLSDDLLLYTDKISMHYGLEARVPILDNELIEFIESLPVKFRIKGYKGKYIHKKFAERILPKEIVHRRKKGFQSPVDKWFKGTSGVQFKELLLRENTKFANYFSLNKIKEIFEEHKLGKRNYEKQLFILVSIYYWIEKNIGNDSKI